MIFTSLTFVIFVLIVFISYWSIFKNNQNAILLLASYVFYAYWDWRFSLLLLSYSLIDYYFGLKIYKSSLLFDKRKYLAVSVSFSLIILGFFKYYNFFIQSLVSFFRSIGTPDISLSSLEIVVPLGISFFIFKSISYTVDIYRGNIVPVKSVFNYVTYLAFFPQIASGPIDRASSFLPQLEKKRIFERTKVVDGLKQMLWGFFKKIVIADSLAIIVNRTFNDPYSFSGGELLLATIFFAFQIYTDFSGYSDIANGVSKLLGLNSVKNFDYPYFSKSVTEFWRRWHISLSTWLRDYFYYPLIFSFGNKNRSKIYLSIFLTFILVGLWHGGGWNYIIMGAIFGFYIVLENIIKR